MVGPQSECLPVERLAASFVVAARWRGFRDDQPTIEIEIERAMIWHHGRSIGRLGEVRSDRADLPTSGGNGLVSLLQSKAISILFYRRW
jgi:hypothetical protein